MYLLHGWDESRVKSTQATLGAFGSSSMSVFSMCFSSPLVAVPIHWNFTAAKFQCSSNKKSCSEKWQLADKGLCLAFHPPEFVTFVCQ